MHHHRHTNQAPDRSTAAAASSQVQGQTHLGGLAADVDGVELRGQRQALPAGQPLLVQQGGEAQVVDLARAVVGVRVGAV